MHLIRFFKSVGAEMKQVSWPGVTDTARYWNSGWDFHSVLHFLCGCGLDRAIWLKVPFLMELSVVK